jgi:hypothetical protein
MMNAAAISQKMNELFQPVKLRIKWPGTARKLEDSERDTAAESLDADAEQIKAAAQLFPVDSRGRILSEPWQRCITIRNEARAAWKRATIKYDDGLRLLRRDSVESFRARIAELTADLESAAGDVQAEYYSLRSDARAKLRGLYREENYPDRIDSAFGLSLEWPSLATPQWFMDTMPALYAQVEESTQGRIAGAVAQFEAEALSRLNELIGTLADSLTPGPDGRARTLKTATLENLRGFIAQFRELSIGSAPDIDSLVARAEAVISGVGQPDLRDSAALRASVQGKLAQLRADGAALAEAAPRRRIDR